MKKCLILVNAYSRLKSSLNQSERLRQEFALMGVSAEIRSNNFFACTVEEGGILKNTVGEYDFCVYLDKDKYIARMLEKCGMRLFNRARSIEDCDDKMLTHLALALIQTNHFATQLVGDLHQLLARTHQRILSLLRLGSSRRRRGSSSRRFYTSRGECANYAAAGSFH